MLHIFPNVAAVEFSRSLLTEMQRRDGDPGNRGVIDATIEDLIPVLDYRLGRDGAAYSFIYNFTAPSVETSTHIDIRSTEAFKEDWKFLVYGNPTLNPFGRDEEDFDEFRTERLLKGLFQLRERMDGEPVLEEVPRSFAEIHLHATLGHKVTLTLMAIRALRQVQDIARINWALLGVQVGENYIPQEIIDIICENLGGCPTLDVIFGFDFIKATGDAAWRRDKIAELQRLVTRCVYGTGRVNSYMWRRMLDTDKLEDRYDFGQVYPMVWDLHLEKTAEMVALRQYQAWEETSGSFDVLKKAVAAATGWAERRGFCWPDGCQPENVAPMPLVHPKGFFPLSEKYGRAPRPDDEWLYRLCQWIGWVPKSKTDYWFLPYVWEMMLSKKFGKRKTRFDPGEVAAKCAIGYSDLYYSTRVVSKEL